MENRSGGVSCGGSIRHHAAIDTRQRSIDPYARPLFVSHTLSTDLDRDAFWS
jgi:hypothetical protein